MENLDGTVISTAVPQMARSFGVNPVDLNIGMTSFLLSLAVFIPISGWLADQFGSRTIFAGAIGIFTASSILCGVSSGLWEFTGLVPHAGTEVSGYRLAESRLPRKSQEAKNSKAFS